MRIGIIGIDSSHSAIVAKAVNLDGRYKGVEITCVCGDSAAETEAFANTCNVSSIIDNPSHVIGSIDAVMIMHRHPERHYQAAIPFIKAGVPVFIDKPMTTSTTEARSILNLAKRHRTPIASFSVLPLQPGFATLKSRLSSSDRIISADIFGPCDINDQSGGVFYYGIHSVALALKLLGYDITHIDLLKQEHDVATLFASGGQTVRIHLINDWTQPFTVMIKTATQTLHQVIALGPDYFLPGLDQIIHMFKTGREPEEHKHIAEMISVLERISQLLTSGNTQTKEHM